LTEVVEDFVKPIAPATGVNLTLVLDGPLALDYLGCSGPQLQQDVRGILDSLRKIGCSVAVFPITCVEMQSNLNSMLNLPHNKRHGYTFEAMVKGEVMESFVQTVAKNPEQALEAMNIPVRAITLEQFPGQHQHFDAERYEDFFETVTWGNDVAAREHDTTALLSPCGYAKADITATSSGVAISLSLAMLRLKRSLGIIACLAA
jgi:hypothetical protein